MIVSGSSGITALALIIPSFVRKSAFFKNSYVILVSLLGVSVNFTESISLGNISKLLSVLLTCTESLFKYSVDSSSVV